MLAARSNIQLPHPTVTSARERRADVSQTQDARVAQPFRLLGQYFVGTTIDSIFWTSAVSGAAAANTQATGILTLASGTANSGYAQITTVGRARFIFMHPHVWRAAIRIPDTTVALNTRRWGAFDLGVAPAVNDGLYFELSAAGVLSVCVASGGTVTSVASGSFNVTPTYELDSNVHAYEIHYFVMQAQFFIGFVTLGHFERKRRRTV